VETPDVLEVAGLEPGEKGKLKGEMMCMKAKKERVDRR